MTYASSTPPFEDDRRGLARIDAIAWTNRAVDLLHQPAARRPVRDHADGDRRHRRHRGQRRGDPPLQAHVGLAGGVPDAAHGLDQAGLALGLGLAPQVADVHGEVLRVGAEVVVPDAVVDRRVVEHDTLVAHEQLEQVELRLRELELTRTPPGPPSRRVDAQVGQLDDLVSRCPSGACGASSARSRASSSSSSNGFGR